MVAKQHDVRHVAELFTHHFLGLDCVRRYTGNRSLVAEWSQISTISTLCTDAGVHDPAGQDLFLNSCCNAAGFANCIDRAQMVLVSAACECEIGI